MSCPCQSFPRCHSYYFKSSSVLSFFLVYFGWQQHISFETGYLHLLSLHNILTFEVAIILILKHAASLCISGIPARMALTQAELDFHCSNVASKIEKHFTAPYSDYTVEQFIAFLMDTDIGLLKCASA